MDELTELYQETILDHNRNPHNFKKLEYANNKVEGFNPLCGDHYSLYIHIEDDIIKDISFEGQGCAISKASASIMTTIVKGKTIQEARDYFEQFRHLVTLDEDLPDLDDLGKMAVFAGVREFPARVKCASLAWHTMKSAIENKDQTVSTE